MWRWRMMHRTDCGNPLTLVHFTNILLALFLVATTAAFPGCNHLTTLQSLRNDYFAMRHGQSLANVAKIIVSDPKIATLQYGLSEIGQQQVEEAASDVIALLQHKRYQGVLVISSDLLRARETAQIVVDTLIKQVPGILLYQRQVIIETRLRERWFGDWDGGPDSNYQKVWNEDAHDPTHEINGVESVEFVMDRATRCIVEWDAQVGGYLCICVAHGDVLQILQTAFRKMDGSLHRSLDHLETAKLRQLTLARNP